MTDSGMQTASVPTGKATLSAQELTFAALIGLCHRHVDDEGFFGNSRYLATDVYRRSLIGDAFPSFWMEVPLAGAPGFDLHVYYDRGQIQPGDHFGEGCGFGMQALFDWYSGHETGGVGVGFAHDLRGEHIATGAYVNFNRRPLADTRGFFSALGNEEAHEDAAALLARIPSSWRPWYLGLFPDRPHAGVRVGAFVGPERQARYARDRCALAGDLTRAGFTAFDDEMLSKLQILAAQPYTLELQLDAVGQTTGDTLGADLTLNLRSAPDTQEAFADDGAGARACKLLESWGIADTRWRQINNATVSKMVPMRTDAGIAPLLMACVPSFIKAKWTATQAQAAKVYLKCAAHPIGSDSQRH